MLEGRSGKVRESRTGGQTVPGYTQTDRQIVKEKFVLNRTLNPPGTVVLSYTLTTNRCFYAEIVE